MIYLVQRIRFTLSPSISEKPDITFSDIAQKACKASILLLIWKTIMEGKQLNTEYLWKKKFHSKCLMIKRQADWL